MAGRRAAARVDPTTGDPLRGAPSGTAHRLARAVRSSASATCWAAWSEYGSVAWGALRNAAKDLEDLDGEQVDTLEPAIAHLAHLALDVRGTASVTVLHEEP